MLTEKKKQKNKKQKNIYGNIYFKYSIKGTKARK